MSSTFAKCWTWWCHMQLSLESHSLWGVSGSIWGSRRHVAMNASPFSPPSFPFLYSLCLPRSLLSPHHTYAHTYTCTYIYACTSWVSTSMRMLDSSKREHGCKQGFYNASGYHDMHDDQMHYTRHVYTYYTYSSQSLIFFSNSLVYFGLTFSLIHLAIMDDDKVFRKTAHGDILTAHHVIVRAWTWENGEKGELVLSTVIYPDEVEKFEESFFSEKPRSKYTTSYHYHKLHFRYSLK